MALTPLKSLTVPQQQLLLFMTFCHLPQSQSAMGVRFPNRQRPDLQKDLQSLVQSGWVVPSGGRWKVPLELQECVARFGWRHQLLETFVRPPAPAVVRPERGGPTRDLRLALYSREPLLFAQHAKAGGSLEALWKPFDPQWLSWLEPSIRRQMIEARLTQACFPSGEVHYLEEAVLSSPRDYPAEGVLRLAFHGLMQGRIERALQLLDAVEHPGALACRGFAALQRGQAEASCQLYAQARTELRKRTGRRKVGFGPEFGWLEALALIELRRWPELTKWTELEEPGLPILRQLADHARGRNQCQQLPSWSSGQGLEGLLRALLLSCSDADQAEWMLEIARLRSEETLWLAAEYASLLGRRDPEWQSRAEQAHQALGTRSLLQSLQAYPSWRASLDLLAQLCSEAKSGRQTGSSQRRMVWLVGVYGGGQTLSIAPLEQSLQANRLWSKGRPVALERLKLEHRSLDFLSQADHSICEAIRFVSGPVVAAWGDYQLDANAAAVHLIGHPLVFDQHDLRPLQVQSVRPQLLVSPQAGHWLARMVAPPRYRAKPACLEVLVWNECESKLNSILGQGLKVPPEGQSRLAELLSRLPQVMVADLPPCPEDELAEQLKRALG